MLGSDLACKIARIGTIDIKMFNGEIRNLDQIRYVPELKRNLISLGMFDQLGCSIKAENIKIHVMKNSTTIIKGVRRNDLYALVGSCLLLRITATVSNDKTKLWHLRLEHMSERGLKELEKQGLFGEDHISLLEFCEKCVFGKTTRKKFKTRRKETK